MRWPGLPGRLPRWRTRADIDGGRSAGPPPRRTPVNPRCGENTSRLDTKSSSIGQSFSAVRFATVPVIAAARSEATKACRTASRYQSCLHPAMAPGPSAGEIRTRISRIPNSGNLIRAFGNEMHCVTRSYWAGATRIALRAATLITASAHQRWVRSGLCHESPCAEIAVGRLLRPRRGPGACNPATRRAGSPRRRAR
jgi:hypothetical protein